MTEKQPAHRSAHVVGTQDGQPLRKFASSLNAKDIEAEADVLVLAGVVIC